MPIVVFPTNNTCDFVRKSTPVLFLAIMSVASGQDYPHIQAPLNTEIMGIFADRFFVKGEKSLEIVKLSKSSLYGTGQIQTAIRNTTNSYTMLQS